MTASLIHIKYRSVFEYFTINYIKSPKIFCYFDIIFIYFCGMILNNLSHAKKTIHYSNYGVCIDCKCVSNFRSD